MMYFYQNESGGEVGPLEQSVLETAIQNGEVGADTPVRTDLLTAWKKARDFRVFARHFEDGGDAAAESERLSFRERFVHDEKQSSAFLQSHTPGAAGILKRVKAFLFDAVILFGCGCLIYGLLFFLPLRSATLEISPAAAPAPAVEQTESAEPADGKTTAAQPSSATAKGAVKKSSGGGVRALFPSIGKVEQLNSDRNAAVEKAANGGEKKSAESKEKPKEVKYRRTFSGAMEAVDDGSSKPKSDQQDKVSELTGRAKEALGKVEVPTLAVDRLTVADDVLTIRHADGGVAQIPLKSYRAHWFAASLVFLAAVFLYYCLTLGYYAQTPGMWYFGIFLTRKNIREAGYLRCCCYSAAFLLFNVLSLPCVFFSGRSPAEWLCGVRIINVYGATKSK